MDRFKFRAWNHKSEEMCDVHGWVNDSNGRLIHIYRNESCDNVETYEIDPVDETRELTLMQCTGLKDINQKLIFEGDIIERPSDTYIRYLVEWDRDAFVGRNVKNKNHSTSLPVLARSGEILGSKFERPELLNFE